MAGDGRHCAPTGPAAAPRVPSSGGSVLAANRRAHRVSRLQRAAAALLVVVVVPVTVALGAAAEDQPIREGEPAPRTILAERQVRVVDEEATERARRSAAESVEATKVVDREAQSAIVRDVRGVFADTRSARVPDAAADEDEERTARPPSTAQQVEALRDLRGELTEDLAASLVALSDADLEVVERETVAIAQELARQEIESDEVEERLGEVLPLEFALRPFPGETAAEIAEPLLTLKLRPTVVVDLERTDANREAAAAEVPEEVSTWQPGQAIVREGAIVGPLEYRAIAEIGLGGGSLVVALLRAMAAMLVVAVVASVYLRRMQPRVWAASQKLLLLGLLTAGYAGLVVAAGLLEGSASGWAYAVPAGALAMLTALLIHPVVGIATMLPAAVIALLVLPSSPAVGLFAAVAVLVSVPLTTRIATRSDLRSATLRAGLSYPALAVTMVLVFGPREDLLVALVAGALNGLVTAIAVQGAMPFLETLFRLPTVTSLLDLNARDHPLLRELEAKALGTYNHSVMVASLTERACRAVGADPLLGSVAALYHDIGKVRQPHFFIENQQGIANPHDELEPAVSAVIIQNHVVDGVEMAQEHHLPPEVVACIGSHHGTMLVSYFYEQALRAAGGDRSSVDEEHYRYKGGKPHSKEAAILLLADCCEATTRSMAMSRGTLPREEIEDTVDRLLAERVDDGQFAASDLTFRELTIARDTIVESLVGIYHPRIAYPARTNGDGAEAAGRDDDRGIRPDGDGGVAQPTTGAAAGDGAGPDVQDQTPAPLSPPR
jgi:cyclic-di-AMP phosphodiesterase PgpH